MLEDKKSNFQLYVQRNPYSADVVVSMCINTKVDGRCLDKLKGAVQEPNSDLNTCLAFAVYLNVKNELTGNPLAMKKTKVGDVKCGVSNGKFFITWNTKANMSAVRKTLSLACKVLSPAKYFSSYSNSVRAIGAKVSREEFTHLADEMNKSIKKELCCCVIGNIKAKPAQMKQVLDAMAKKFNPKKAEGKKTKPKPTPNVESSCVKLNVSGWEKHVLLDYIVSNAIGVCPQKVSNGLLINMDKSKWQTISKKLKKNSKRYVQQKFVKLGDELGNVMAYLAISHGSCSCKDVKQLCGKKLSADKIVSAINSNL